MPRPVSIRQSLFRNVALVILLLGGGILATTVVGARSAVRSLSSTIIARTIGEIDARLRGFFDPVSAELLVSRAWGEAGLLDLTDEGALNRLLGAVVREHPQVSSIVVADGRGREHMVMRRNDGWRSRQVRRDEWGPRAEWLDWSDEQPAPVRSRETLDYDPRDRPWYRGATSTRTPGAAPEVHWTPPYTFFTSQTPGITASVIAVDPRGVEHVIAFDVLLDEISNFTAGLSASPNGLVFVLSDDGRMIGLPDNRFWSGPDARRAALLRTPEELGVAVVRDAADELRESDRTTTDPVRFESDGISWWGDAIGFPISDDRELWIAVLVPERDLLAGLVTTRLSIIAITLLVLAAAITRAMFLAGRYSEPIEALVAESDRMSRGDLEPGPPIPARLREIGRLAEAHDRMRVGLRSLLKLERDLQVARQIQQGTFPTALPTLPGYDLVAWSEPAEETGGDTYDVIGHVRRPGPDGPPLRHVTTTRADGVVFMLADATGHGIGPALSATEVRAMLRMAVRLDENLPELVRHLNEQLTADLPEGRFVTAWFGALTAGDHTLESLSTGQAPLLHYHASRREVEVRDADTMPLGVVADLDAGSVRIRMEPGDVFAVLSDGLFEAMNPEDELFGTDRIVEVVHANHHASPDQLLDALRNAVDTFTRGRAATDDRTAVVLKRRDEDA